MAMTQLALLFLGSFATLTTLGLFVDFGDDITGALVGFVGALTWGLFGVSAFDVIVRQTPFASASEPITPLAYLGIGLSVVVGLFSVKRLLAGVRQETEAASADGLLK